MSGLFANSKFAGFGPDPLRSPVDSPAFDHVAAGKRAELRKLLRKMCPRLPGVYGMLDLRGRLIYVGKAKVLRHRLLSYFLKGNRNEKAGRILRHTQTIVWEAGPCEFAALVRELELIRRWRPRHNVQGMPDRERQIYVCLGKRPAPYLYLSREPTGNEVACFGPVKGVRIARDAVRRLNDLFKLRDCAQTQAMHFADQRELFPILHTAGCLRYELNTCLGPCAAFTSRSSYGKHVRAVKAFLEGRDRGPLTKLESEMAGAAERFDYEAAASMRDRIQPIRWLRERLGWVDEARDRHSCVYPQESESHGTVWYLIRRGRVCAAVPAPTDAMSARSAAEALRRIFVDEKNWPNLAPLNQVDHVLLVAAWFRRRPEELQQTLAPAKALALCQGLLQGSLVRSA
jgi:excinuclease ABC subunit C